MTRKIIIDTDPGIDDAMAIFYALESERLDIVGLTTIFGNCLTTQSTQNALSLLEIAGRTDIPVAKGTDHCLARAFSDPAAFVHGADGQGDVDLKPPITTVVDETAAHFIVDQIMSQPEEITLVPIGPLTNIALALHLEPRIAINVKEVVMMGGAAFCPGNVSPAAEANIFNDAEAADVVFSAKWPMTMVGLDVTQQVHMSTAQLAAFGHSQKATSQHIAKILPKYIDFHEAYYPGIDGIYVHDSTAITYLLDPSIFEVKQAPVVVETQGISRGTTWAGTAHRLRSPWADRQPVTICVEVDAAKAIEMEMSTV